VTPLFSEVCARANEDFTVHSEGGGEAQPAGPAFSFPYVFLFSLPQSRTRAVGLLGRAFASLLF